MAPKIKFTKEQILEQAFLIAQEEGMTAVSVRKLASALGSSVAPIYVNYKNAEELMQDLKQKIKGILWKYMTREYTSLGFFNIGVGHILFAKAYPNIARDIISGQMMELEENKYCAEEIIEIMKQDELLKKVPENCYKDLLDTMTLLTNGIWVEIITGKIEIPTSKYIQLMERTGAQLVYAYSTVDSKEVQSFIKWNVKIEEIEDM